VTAAWTRAHLGTVDVSGCQTRVLRDDETTPILPGHYLWDLWPLRRTDGTVPGFAGDQLWMSLSADRGLLPTQRHDVARLRLMRRSGAHWTDLGPVFADGQTAGTREWAGSAVVSDDGLRVTVRYTAVGYRGRAEGRFAQRLFEATASFDPDADPPLRDWGEHRELVAQEHPYRSTLDQDTGTAGFIKAFRDPWVLVDDATGQQHLLFTASLAQSRTDYDAAVGHATRAAATQPWSLQEPLLSADAVNNEMERPHVVQHAGLYYLFFSTQERTFDPGVRGPTGLYGFAAPSMSGPWEPLNGSGLVFCNPAAEPHQAYSWLVLPDLSVAAFVDMYALAGRQPQRTAESERGPAHFGGTIAPVEHIGLDGKRAWLEPSV
jgi:levansucrase